VDIAIISWLIVQMTDSPFLVALVMVIRLAPISLLGPLAGVLADRVDRVLVMRTSRGFMVAVQIAIALTVATGDLALWQLYLVVGIAGIAWTFDMAARRSLTPDLVDSPLLISAIAVEMLIMTGTLMTGPIIVGSLAPYLPLEAFFLTSAALIAVSAIQIGGVENGVGSRSRPGVTFRRSLAAGFAVVWNNPPIAGALDSPFRQYP
jgi:MFS family permease